MLTEIRTLIIEDEILEAIKKSLKYVYSDASKNEISLIWARFNDLEKLDRQGVLDFKERSQLRNKIRVDLLSAVENSNHSNKRKPKRNRITSTYERDLDYEFSSNKDIYSFYPNVISQKKEAQKRGHSRFFLKDLKWSTNYLRQIKEDYEESLKLLEIDSFKDFNGKTIVFDLQGWRDKIYDIKENTNVRNCDRNANMIKHYRFQKINLRRIQFTHLKNAVISNYDLSNIFKKVYFDFDLMIKNFVESDYQTIDPYPYIETYSESLRELKSSFSNSLDTKNAEEYVTKYMSFDTFKNNLILSIADLNHQYSTRNFAFRQAAKKKDGYHKKF